MNDVLNTKPELLSPKANWHYDSYFLSQLEHRHNRTPISASAEHVERVILDRNEIIKQINDLADSIGVSVRLIETTSV